MKTQKAKNQFLIRISNIDTLNSIERLYGTNKFDSKNQMMNEIVERGLASVMAEYGMRGTFEKPIDVNDEVTQRTLAEIKANMKLLQLNTDDIFVMMSVMESITATLLNIKLCEMQGQSIDADTVESGYMSTLPPFLQQVKQQVTNRIYKRTNK